MFDILLTRWRQGHRTMRYPAGPAPELPDRFVGRPTIDAAKCTGECRACDAVCPTGALGFDAAGKLSQLDAGRCLFCRKCESACGAGAIAFSRDHRLAASRREDLIVLGNDVPLLGSSSAESNPTGRHGACQAVAHEERCTLDATMRCLFSRSLKLRQVSAGGCNACEADTNVLGTLTWDLGRFGIQFVASPRHADGLLVTGPVPENMRRALRKTYEAVPGPKLVIAVGGCAISGGPYVDHAEVHNGVAGQLPVDLFVPGCPPHPLTILEGLLSLLGRIAEQ